MTVVMITVTPAEAQRELDRLCSVPYCVHVKCKNCYGHTEDCMGRYECLFTQVTSHSRVQSVYRSNSGEVLFDMLDIVRHVVCPGPDAQDCHRCPLYHRTRMVCKIDLIVSCARKNGMPL